jgi:DMSO/TMAO reductase YedYZ molybdopterin-dependent catalytic subunit
VRLVVPGWYGVASVKWLRRIEVTDRPFQGYFQTSKYTIQRTGRHGPETQIVRAMSVKSEIIRPSEGQMLGIGTNRIFGVAWGPEAIAAVEVSTDGGASWNGAQLIGPRAAYSWTLWEYLWEVADAGDYSLLARAVSANGQVQPARHEPLNGGYQIHFSRPRAVSVTRARQIQDAISDPGLLVYDMNAFAEENMRLPLDVDMNFCSGEGI